MAIKLVTTLLLIAFVFTRWTNATPLLSDTHRSQRDTSTSDADLHELIKSVFNTNLGLPNQQKQNQNYEVTSPRTQRSSDDNDDPDDDLKALLEKIFTTERPSTHTTPLEPNADCGFGRQCIREYLCGNGRKNKDGATLINVRSNFDFDNPRECPFGETCCAVESIVDQPIIRPTQTSTGCGYRNVEGVGLKIEGYTNEAEFGEFPWMVAVMQGRSDDDTNRNIYRCGGSLIHPKIVLTAAHCVYDHPAYAFKARAGEWETNSINELYPHQDRLVKDMVVHESYNNNNLRYDIALLFLEKPFDLAPNVNTVCLPPPDRNFDFAHCFASGWGKDQFGNGQYQNILKKIELPVVPSYVCQDNLRQTRLGKYFELHKTFMCAGGEGGKDTCEGDGGSPLVCPADEASHRYFQAGIVAWGIGCGGKDVPGVYANVAELRPWIDKQLSFRDIDASYFNFRKR